MKLLKPRAFRRVLSTSSSFFPQFMLANEIIYLSL